MPKSKPAPKTQHLEYKEKIENEALDLVGNSHAKPGTSYLFKPLSPFHSYMDGYLADDENKKHGETYHRSEHSPHKDKKVNKYYAKKMLNGDRAHLGAYANNFERTGDFFRVSRLPNGTRVILHPHTTPGDALLYDAILNYKLSLCKSLAKKIGNEDYIKAGFYNNYPCLMVYVKPASIHKAAENEYVPTDPALKAWANFLISIYVGYVNFEAKKKNIDIELVRRSSFGFLSPSIAVTVSSIRINVGIVPDAYVDVLADGLERLNEVLSYLHNKRKIKQSLPADCFYGKTAHKNYLKTGRAKNYATPVLDDIFQLLWQQVENGGKTTLQNMMRTSFCRDGISAKVYESLEEDAENFLAAMTAGLEWALSRMAVTKKGKGKQLSFDNNGTIAYPLSTRAEAIEKKFEDTKFWDFIRQVTTAAKENYNDNADIQALIKDINTRAKHQFVSGIYKQLEVLNELILLDVLKQQTAVPSRSFEDGYGSDSEDEAPFDDETVHSRKLIVSNGMRATLATLLAIGSKLKDFSLYVDSAYYEIAYGIDLLESFEDQAITLRKPVAMTTASTYLFDVNACVTDGVATKSNFNTFANKTKNKFLVLDTTSATTDQMHNYVKFFSQTRARSMIFVSSGLKNEQLGADKNAYGTIRLFTKNKSLLRNYYNTIKKKEPPVDSPISHEYRRAQKQLGAVPTISAIFKK